MNWPRQVAIRSHEPAFLWRTATAIVVAGLLVSIPLRITQRGLDDPVLRCVLQAQTTPDHPWQAVHSLLVSGEATFYQTLDAIGRLARSTDKQPPVELLRAADRRVSGASASLIIQELIQSLRTGKPTAELLRLASQRPVVRYTNFALANAALSAGEEPLAEAALRAEGEHPDALAARELLVSLLASQENWQALADLAKQDGYQSLVPHSVATQLAAERGDWLTVLRRTPLHLFDSAGVGPVVLSSLSGVCWLAFVLHAGRVGQGGVRWTYCLAAVALGVLSVALTLLFIYWQEEGWGLRQREDLAGSVRYFVLGVGLREELAKLILLLPLVPFLVRDRNELQALLVCACVGLGFAMEENASYVDGSAASAISRLTTANFLHMSLTGLVGLAFCRACWRPKSLGPEFLGVFCLAVLAHGFYDALIATPALAEYSIVSLILYVLVVRQFFHEFNEIRPPGVYRLNLSFTLTVGVALVASATFVVLSMQVGHWLALQLMGATLVGSAATIYLFLREAPDSLVDR